MNYQTKKSIEVLSPQIRSIVKDMIGEKSIGQLALQKKYKSSVGAIKNVLAHCGYDAESLVNQWRAKQGLSPSKKHAAKITGSDGDEQKASIPNKILRRAWICSQ